MTQSLSCSNLPGTTSTHITRPSLRSSSLRHVRTLQLLHQPPEERWTGVRQGAGGEASSHLGSFGSVVGVLSRFAGRGGRGGDGREQVGAVAGRRRMGVEGERGQDTCLAGLTEQNRCDGKLNLGHIHSMLYLICCSLYFLHLWEFSWKLKFS